MNQIIEFVKEHRVLILIVVLLLVFLLIYYKCKRESSEEEETTTETGVPFVRKSRIHQYNSGFNH